MDTNTIEQKETHQTNSVTLKKMMAEIATPDTFNPPCHELSTAVQNDLELLLQEYESQFAKDETSIGNTPLTSVTIYTGTSKPISQKPYPIAMKHYQWVKDEIEKIACSKSNSYQQIQLVSPNHSSTQRSWRRMFSDRLQSS